MKDFKNKPFAYLSIALILFGALVPSATAQEAVVAENGAGTTNEINVTQSNNTSSTQSNTAAITNNVTTNSNTGGNTASSNTGGDTIIATGDSVTSTEVVNTGNVSVVNLGSCDCPDTNSAVVVGNGANSSNTVNNSTSNNTNVSTNNTANVTNNLLTNANTGNNNASLNSGNVSIVTGRIFASTSLLNGPFNVSKVRVSQARNVDKLLKIAGNGVSSINTINNVENNNIVVSENNIATFINNIINNLNTGGNNASLNNGDVSIITGDVWAEIKIKNLANLNEVIIDCDCKTKPGEKNPIVPPSITTTPPSSSTGGPSVNSGPSSSGGSSSVAAAIANLLPATGTNWLMLALFGNIMMLLLGAFLRLRSGRSPGMTLAI